MSNLVQDMIESRINSKRPLMVFGEALDCDYQYILCIEGNDEPYYSSVLRTKLNTDKICFIRCNGRENVINLLKTLSIHTDVKYRNSSYFGFVDKDYHIEYVNLFPERLYITSSYSFENYYTSLESYKRVLSAIFHTKPYGHFVEDYQRCHDNFLSLRNSFVDNIYQIDHILRAVFHDSLEEICTEKVTYADKVKLANSIFTLEEFTPNWSQTVNNWLDNTDQYVSAANFEKFKFFYEDYDHESLSIEIRGKYLLEFYIKYIKLILQDANSETPAICFKQRRDCVIKRDALQAERKKLPNDDGYYCISLKESSLDDPIGFLATYADIPANLSEFIDNNMRVQSNLASAS